MSVSTLCNTRSLGVHVVEVGEQALRSSWEGGYDECEEDDEEEGRMMPLVDEEGSNVSRGQLALIYSLQLAEAYVSLSSPCLAHLHLLYPRVLALESGCTNWD